MVNIKQQIFGFKSLQVFTNLAFIIVSIIISSQFVFSQNDGGYSSSFLLRNQGARPVAMAGAYTAVSNEPGAIFYNPAGIGFLSDVPLVNSSVSMIGLGRNQTSLSWAQQIYPNFGMGLAFNSFSGGSFMGRDIKGVPTVELSDFQFCMSLAAAYRIEFMSMGANIKFINSSLNGSPTSASGVALDVGTKFDVFDMFSFGISVQNISGMMFWNTLNNDREDIPFTIRTGLAMEYGLNEDTYLTRSSVTGDEEKIFVPATKYILFSLDAVFTQFERSPEIILGAELAAHELIAFRSGISLYGDKFGEPQLLPMNHWGAGLSLRPGFKKMPFKLNIDYTIANEFLANNGISHHITLLFEF
jgi:hypothetical protein